MGPRRVPSGSRGTVADILGQIVALPDDWLLAGTLASAVLARIAEHAGLIRRSAETGTGKSTLLLSHLSSAHTVFAKEDAHEGGSLAVVRASPLLRAEAVAFVVGPSQR